MEKTFEWVNNIITANIEYQKDVFSDINYLLEKYTETKRECEKKIPYHINILDLLWANENAHSRVLGHLLRQNDNGNYRILSQFFKFLKQENSQFDFTIQKPNISVETDRIDILIKDKNYAIIIENKIHNANDQYEQLGRYIDKVKDLGYKEEQIFIIYAPRQDWKIPEDQSWGNYKETFKDRFLNISFISILNWLENDVLPNIRLKEIYLKSALEQYIDHLKGLLLLRKNQEKMNVELQKRISEILGFNDDNQENLTIIENKMKELDEVKQQLEKIKRIEYFKKWYKDLGNDFPNIEITSETYGGYDVNVGIILEYQGKQMRIMIGYEESNNYFYYGVTVYPPKSSKEESIEELVKDNGISKNSTGSWYGWERTKYEEAYEELTTLIKNIQSKIK